MRRVTVTNAHPRYRISKKLIGRYVTRVLRSHRAGGDVSVVFVESQFMRRINKKYLGHTNDTDVITFPMEDGPPLEGEIYINLDRARMQAKQEHVRFGEEVARLVIHGTLHLVGYDDKTRETAAGMRLEEDRQVRHWRSRTRRIG